MHKSMMEDEPYRVLVIDELMGGSLMNWWVDLNWIKILRYYICPCTFASFDIDTVFVLHID